MSRILQVPLPEFGHGITEALIIEWRVQPGDTVRRGDAIAELETDKSSVELVAEHPGIVRSILADARSILESGSPLYTIEVDQEG
ncbi:biotin/lipoyl-containing protein [Millisia brevis]|uniref:biotin/lipoyl-containing protein n=1 Tax=Millisia brevis TaxID=264148 RepID=UPI0008362E44|nr:lipoyl domain-containing protein [Millisia brevis]